MAFDGTEQLTPLADLLNSVVDAANARLQAGSVTIPIATASVEVSVAVVFPVAYATPPIVIADASTVFPGNRFASASSVTTTGFTATAMNNAGTASIPVRWIAFGT